MEEGTHHGILERIFRVLAIPGHAVDRVEDTPGVACAQFDERPFLAGLRRRYQQVISQRTGLMVVLGDTVTCHAAGTHGNTSGEILEKLYLDKWAGIQQ
jgi:hypothetical protein